MFEQITRSFVDLNERALVHVYKSLNQAQVSPGPGMTALSATAYIFVFRNSTSESEIRVGLHFTENDQQVVYEMPMFQPELINEKMGEAESFVSEMGFLMDNTHYSSASPDEKKEILRKIPFFYKEIGLYKQSLTDSEIEAKKVKAEVGAQKDSMADQQRIFIEQYVTLLSML